MKKSNIWIMLGIVSCMLFIEFYHHYLLRKDKGASLRQIQQWQKELDILLYTPRHAQATFWGLDPDTVERLGVSITLYKRDGGYDYRSHYRRTPQGVFINKARISSIRIKKDSLKISNNDQAKFILETVFEYFSKGRLKQYIREYKFQATYYRPSGVLKNDALPIF